MSARDGSSCIRMHSLRGSKGMAVRSRPSFWLFKLLVVVIFFVTMAVLVAPRFKGLFSEAEDLTGNLDAVRQVLEHKETLGRSDAMPGNPQRQNAGLNRPLKGLYSREGDKEKADPDKPRDPAGWTYEFDAQEAGTPPKKPDSKKTDPYIDL